MADAAAAARERVDRALSLIERRVLDLKARPATARPVADDDLFAPRVDPVRTAELEAAGREASEALAIAAQAIRHALGEDGEAA
jgi:hypothetical protein